MYKQMGTDVSAGGFLRGDGSVDKRTDLLALSGSRCVPPTEEPSLRRKNRPSDGRTVPPTEEPSPLLKRTVPVAKNLFEDSVDLVAEFG